MGDDYLPLELDVESVHVTRAGSGWEYVLERSHADDIVIYEESPDATYDQLFTAGDLTYTEDGDVVRGERHRGDSV